jgi:hypothetical protein
MVLRKIIDPKREEVTGGWRKLQMEEPYDLHFLTDVARVIESRSVRWSRLLTCVGGN